MKVTTHIQTGCRVLARGGLPPHRPRATGFTLIEIMIVVGIMAIVLTMSVPIVYRIAHKEPMRKAVSDIVEVCSHARARAILQGRATALVFDDETASIRVESLSAPAAPVGPGGELAPAAPPPPPEVRASAAAASGKGTVAMLPREVTLSKLIVNGVDYPEFTARVRFFPNGTSDEMIINLVSEKFERAEISLEIMTGLVSVEYDQTKFQVR